MLNFARVLALGLSVASVLASPVVEEPKIEYVKRGNVLYEVFEDADTGARMEFVPNSGVCETTPGVRTISGYFSVGTNMNMFFWFFAARNNPTTAPFAMWLNGGPGCSSQIGLFQENGPCHFIGNATEPVNNPYSFNEYANMIYVDQPIGVGFSYGTDTVTSTVTAAPYVWALLQAFLKKYPTYRSRSLGIFTESYGGHYGPEFSHYIQTQNAAIKSGTVTGLKLNLVALGINNGFYDALLQYPAYISFSLHNKYKQILTQAQAAQYTQTYNQQCKPLLEQCTSPDSALQNVQCATATETCFETIEGPISQGPPDFDVYDVRQGSNDPYPPSNYIAYLNRPDIQQRIGVNNITFQDCSDSADLQFSPSGDDSRPFLETLSEVVQSGVRTLLWAGDADWICNYKGGFTVVNAINYSGKKAFNAMKLKPYTVNGTQGGLFKTLGNLSWLQVFEAGHEVPYYQPAVALQVFRQTMMQQPISST